MNEYIELRKLSSTHFNMWIGLVAFILIVSGAGMLWGSGAAFLAAGLHLYVDQAADDILERFTLIERDIPRKS